MLYVDYLFTQRPISEEDVRLVAQIARFAAIKLETDAPPRRSDPEADHGRGAEDRVDDPAAPAARRAERHRRLHVRRPNRPCRTVSGDYYDFVVRPDGKVYFVIGDVSGKGVTAGLMMAGLQAAFRIYSKSDPDPATLVTQLNVALKENLPQSKFVTLFLGRLDTNTGVIEYANAGHTPPLCCASDGVDGADRNRSAPRRRHARRVTRSARCSSIPATR